MPRVSYNCVTISSWMRKVQYAATLPLTFGRNYICLYVNSFLVISFLSTKWIQEEKIVLQNKEISQVGIHYDVIKKRTILVTRYLNNLLFYNYRTLHEHIFGIPFYSDISICLCIEKNRRKSVAKKM